MQAYIQPAFYFLVLLIPCLILSIFFLIDLKSRKGQERLSTLLGFFTFTLLTIALLMTITDLYFTLYTDIWSNDPFYIIISPIYDLVVNVMLGVGFVLLAFWRLACVHPDWLYSHKTVSTIAGLLLGFVYSLSLFLILFLGTWMYRHRLLLPIHLVQAYQTIFPTLMTIGNILYWTTMTTVFFLAIAFTIQKTASNFMTILLLIGLAFVYLLHIPILTLYLGDIMLLGFYLILAWYIINKMEHTTPPPLKPTPAP